MNIVRMVDYEFLLLKFSSFVQRKYIIMFSPYNQHILQGQNHTSNSFTIEVTRKRKWSDIRMEMNESRVVFQLLCIPVGEVLDSVFHHFQQLNRSRVPSSLFCSLHTISGIPKNGLSYQKEYSEFWCRYVNKVSIH